MKARNVALLLGKKVVLEIENDGVINYILGTLKMEDTRLTTAGLGHVPQGNVEAYSAKLHDDKKDHDNPKRRMFVIEYVKNGNTNITYSYGCCEVWAVIERGICDIPLHAREANKEDEAAYNKIKNYFTFGD